MATCAAGSPPSPTSTSPARAPTSRTPACAALPRRPPPRRSADCSSAPSTTCRCSTSTATSSPSPSTAATPSRSAATTSAAATPPSSSPRSASTTTARSALAKELVDLAKAAGADCVKFQLRDMAALYRGGTGSAGEDLGPQYTLDLLSRFNLTADQIFEVFDHCRDVDIDIMCTPWDDPSVDALVGYGIAALKVASADLTNHALLTHAAASGTPLVRLDRHVDRDRDPRERSRVLRASGTAVRPAPLPVDLPGALQGRQPALPRPGSPRSATARSATPATSAASTCPLAAVALGATVIEKHFTVDRGMEGNDHKVTPAARPSSPRWSCASARSRRPSAAPRRGRCRTGELHEPRQPRQEPRRRPRPRAGRRHRPRRDRHQEPRPRPAAQPPRPSSSAGPPTRDLRAGDFFYASDLSDYARRRAATTRSDARGACPCASTTSSASRADSHPRLPRVPLLATRTSRSTPPR